MSANEKLKLKKKSIPEQKTCYLKFSGSITEETVFDSLLGLPEPILIFDMEELSMINSCGIRSWILFLDSVSKVKEKLIYWNCPVFLVEQFNMVHGFIPKNSVVESFKAPFFCSTCDESKSVLIKTADTKRGSQIPEQVCSKCSTAMEFDAFEDQFFEFLK